MRGALQHGLIPTHFQRIIPADAGSTRSELLRMDCDRDHPRGCGEHTIYTKAQAFQLGSSPRMRGAPASAFRPDAWSRIIPADAGRTAVGTGRNIGSKDHPRGCGEHIFNTDMAHWTMGSSPRMRGAPQARARKLLRKRIIPADAGSTS